MTRPLVFVHGYPDTYAGFNAWEKVVRRWSRPAQAIQIGNYVSLSNEVTLKPDDLEQLHLRLIASSGTQLVAYHEWLYVRGG